MITRAANNNNEDGCGSGGGDNVDRNSGAPVPGSLLAEAKTTKTVAAEEIPVVNQHKEEEEEEVAGDEHDDRYDHGQKKMKEEQEQEQEKDQGASSSDQDRAIQETMVDDDIPVPAGGPAAGSGTGAAAPYFCPDYLERKKEKDQEKEKRAGFFLKPHTPGQNNGGTAGETINVPGPAGADVVAAADADAKRGGTADVRPSLLRLSPAPRPSESSSANSPPPPPSGTDHPSSSAGRLRRDIRRAVEQSLRRSMALTMVEGGISSRMSLPIPVPSEELLQPYQASSDTPGAYHVTPGAGSARSSRGERRMSISSFVTSSLSTSASASGNPSFVTPPPSTEGQDCHPLQQRGVPGHPSQQVRRHDVPIDDDNSAARALSARAFAVAAPLRNDGGMERHGMDG